MDLILNSSYTKGLLETSKWMHFIACASVFLLYDVVLFLKLKHFALARHVRHLIIFRAWLGKMPLSIKSINLSLNLEVLYLFFIKKNLNMNYKLILSLGLRTRKILNGGLELPNFSKHFASSLTAFISVNPCNPMKQNQVASEIFELDIMLMNGPLVI